MKKAKGARKIYCEWRQWLLYLNKDTPLSDQNNLLYKLSLPVCVLEQVKDGLFFVSTGVLNMLAWIVELIHEKDHWATVSITHWVSDRIVTHNLPITSEVL